MRRAGRAFLWRLEVDHALVPSLREAFRQEDSLREDLLKTLRTGLPSHGILSARVYGSVIEGRDSPRSDIDMYVEVAESRGRERIQPALERLETEVFRRYGSPLSVIVYTSREATHPRNRNLMLNIQAQGWDVL